MRMRDGYGLCAALMFGDLFVFWLLKQFGVFKIGEVPPNWVRVIFLVLLYASGIIGMSLLLYGAKVGITYDRGRKIKFSENPFYFWVVFIMSVSAFVLLLYGLTIVLLGRGT